MLFIKRILCLLNDLEISFWRDQGFQSIKTLSKVGESYISDRKQAKETRIDTDNSSPKSFFVSAITSAKVKAPSVPTSCTW
jgi:hypothetical protein